MAENSLKLSAEEMLEKLKELLESLKKFFEGQREKMEQKRHDKSGKAPTLYEKAEKALANCEKAVDEMREIQEYTAQNTAFIASLLNNTQSFADRIQHMSPEEVAKETMNFAEELRKTKERILAETDKSSVQKTLESTLGKKINPDEVKVLLSKDNNRVYIQANDRLYVAASRTRGNEAKQEIRLIKSDISLLPELHEAVRGETLEDTVIDTLNFANRTVYSRKKEEQENFRKQNELHRLIPEKDKLYENDGNLQWTYRDGTFRIRDKESGNMLEFAIADGKMTATFYEKSDDELNGVGKRTLAGKWEGKESGGCIANYYGDGNAAIKKLMTSEVSLSIIGWAAGASRDNILTGYNLQPEIFSRKKENVYLTMDGKKRIDELDRALKDIADSYGCEVTSSIQGGTAAIYISTPENNQYIIKTDENGEIKAHFYQEGENGKIQKVLGENGMVCHPEVVNSAAFNQCLRLVSVASRNVQEKNLAEMAEKMEDLHLESSEVYQKRADEMLRRYAENQGIEGEISNIRFYAEGADTFHIETDYRHVTLNLSHDTGQVLSAEADGKVFYTAGMKDVPTPETTSADKTYDLMIVAAFLENQYNPEKPYTSMENAVYRGVDIDRVKLILDDIQGMASRNWQLERIFKENYTSLPDETKLLIVASGNVNEKLQQYLSSNMEISEATKFAELREAVFDIIQKQEETKENTPEQNTQETPEQESPEYPDME